MVVVLGFEILEKLPRVLQKRNGREMESYYDEVHQRELGMSLAR